MFTIKIELYVHIYIKLPILYINVYINHHILFHFQIKNVQKQKKKIDEEFKDIFSNLKSYSATINHAYDKSGKSKQIQTNYVFGGSAHKDDHIRTECTSWSEEIKQKDGFKDSLIVIAMTEEILKWIDNNYD